MTVVLFILLSPVKVYFSQFELRLGAMQQLKLVRDPMLMKLNGMNCSK
jgi:hypothetical protein